jgi:DNA-binding PadR family transcriptional regulator
MRGHGFGRCEGWSAGAGRGGWGFGAFDPAGSGWFWGGGRRRGGPFGGGRMFEQGDLKYVILRLLEEKPRHGYEIIKELEDRFGGLYSPSPGTVYPTLTMLEDLGYARATAEEGGKKIYEITPEGRAYLAEHKSTVDDIFERIAQFGASFFSGPSPEVKQAYKDLVRDVSRVLSNVGRAAYAAGPGHHPDHVERLRKIQEVLERAAREIEEIGRERGAASGPAASV